jgi:hypothetical protein
VVLIPLPATHVTGALQPGDTVCCTKRSMGIQINGVVPNVRTSEKLMYRQWSTLVSPALRSTAQSSIDALISTVIVGNLASTTIGVALM